MSALIIEPIDEALEAKLRARAAQNGRSLEEEVKQILASTLAQRSPPADNMADAIAAIVDPIGGIELDLPPRHWQREPPRFDDWPEPEV